MTEQSTVSYSLESILRGIDSKLDTIQRDITSLQVSQARLEQKVESIEKQLDGIDKRLTKVENSQDTLVKDVADLKGVKSLIIPIVVAITTSLVTLLLRAIPVHF